MNERVKQLRKHLGLSGEKFGNSIGISRDAVSKIETGKNNLTEQSILSICREFNVNEDWLRHGTGDMFISKDKISLDTIALNNSVDPLETDIIKAYFSLPKDLRKQALEHFKKSLKG